MYGCFICHGVSLCDEEPKPCSCETLEDHIILGKCDVIAPKRLITNRDTTELQLVLARQQKEIVREFISLREDTFTQLNDRCNFDETKIHILRVLTKDTDRFRGITNWSDFEFELFNKFCSWFNFEIIEYIRSHDKILQLNPNSDKHMLDYKRKFYLFCRRRCFYVGGTLHNGQLLGPRLTFKVHECYKKYVLNDVIAIKMIIYETLNLKSYQIYVDTVTEGCVQVTCSIAPCCTIPTKLSQHQITQLQKHKIFSLKINEEELMDTLEKDVDFLNLSDTEGKPIQNYVFAGVDLGGVVQGVATPPNGQSHSIKYSTTNVLRYAQALIYIAKNSVVVVVSSNRVVKPLSRQAVVQPEVLHLLECLLGHSTVLGRGN